MRNRPLPTPKAYTPAPETHKGSQNVPVEDVVGRRYSAGNAECVDDQGLRFDLFRPKLGY